MVKMMRKDQIEKLSAEGRVRNSYEAMYYRTDSGDPEVDEIVRSEIQHSFRRHGITLSDQPNNETLRNIMLDAYKKSAQELGGSTITSERSSNLTRDFDAFTKNHPDFYKTSFDAYEDKYNGETVDFFADYDRVIQESNGTGLAWEPTEADLNAMERDRLTQFSREAVMKKPTGLSYVGHAPGVQTQSRRSYRQIKMEEAAAQEMKGNKYDVEYDRYARSRGDSYQKTTAGDDYGFDERDYDDGPEF